MGKLEQSWEKKQYLEQKETNVVLWVNTIFTVLTGIATLALAYLQLKK